MKVNFFIKNLDELFQYFIKFGPIEEYSIMCDKKSGTPRGMVLFVI